MIVEGNRELRSIPLDVLDEPARAIRKLADFEALEELRSSVAEHGVLVPLVVVRDGDRYRVVAGLRRLLAARAAGLVDVPCVVISGGPANEGWAMFVENRLREAINPLDEALWLGELVQEEGLSNRDLAARLGVSESWVSQRLAITLWPEDVRSGLAEGWLSFTVARELVQIGDERRRRQALRMAKVSGCTARQAADWRRCWQTELGGLTMDNAGGEYREPGDPPPVVEMRCELCMGVLSEYDQRVLVLCPGCKASVDALRAQYEAQSSPQP